ncbi:helix-turn-helix transcriptional regulator [Patulibacter sp. NPDC049589]|uniref:helix-turn-helix transcriptional regulator n=1 Tax=Patulibacter sp. NPDC049589 TaxID=3154731 RepID=UPI00342AE444
MTERNMGPTPPPTPPTRHAELGEFLRLHREGTTPDSVGLQPVGRRRTPGLRREEVSQLAGVGLSWYTWLEQGRDVTPSASVLDALARVLDLAPAERAHLFHLTGVAEPTADGPYPTTAPDDLRSIVDGLDPYPAYLLGPRLDVLGWNAAATRILGTPSAAPDGIPNVLWWMFTSADRDGPAWNETSRNMLARFRGQHARRYDDPAFAALIAALLDASPRFRDLWPRHEVLAAQSGAKVIDTLDHGRLRFHHLQSIPTSSPELRMTQFVPADEHTREAFLRLAEGAGSVARA